MALGHRARLVGGTLGSRVTTTREPTPKAASVPLGHHRYAKRSTHRGTGQRSHPHAQPSRTRRGGQTFSNRLPVAK